MHNHYKCTVGPNLRTMEGVTYTVFVIASVEVKKTNVHEANGKNPSVKVDFMDVDSQEKNSTAL